MGTGVVAALTWPLAITSTWDDEEGQFPGLLCDSPCLHQGGFSAQLGWAWQSRGREIPSHSTGLDHHRAQGRMQQQITVAKSSAQASDTPNRISCSPAPMCNQQQGLVGEGSAFTFISARFGGEILASSTLISPSGILLRHWRMIRRDCRISSTRHRYLRDPQAAQLGACALCGGHPVGKPQPHHRPTEKV